MFDAQFDSPKKREVKMERSLEPEEGVCIVQMDRRAGVPVSRCEPGGLF